MDKAPKDQDAHDLKQPLLEDTFQVNSEIDIVLSFCYVHVSSFLRFSLDDFAHEAAALANPGSVGRQVNHGENQQV